MSRQAGAAFCYNDSSVPYTLHLNPKANSKPKTLKLILNPTSEPTARVPNSFALFAQSPGATLVVVGTVAVLAADGRPKEKRTEGERRRDRERERESRQTTGVSRAS